MVMNNAANSNAASKNLSTKEHAALIRAAYKKAGIKASVRSESFSMGSAINIRVKSGSLKLAREIASSAERIERCDVTGDILSGSNRYLHVDWDDSVVDSKSNEIRGGHHAVIESLGCGYFVNVGEFQVRRVDSYYYMITRVATGEHRRSWGVDGCFDTMARWIIED